jgi:hypothetical protein
VDRFVQQLRQVPDPYLGPAVAGVRAALGPGMEQVAPRAPTPQSRALLDAANALAGGS